MIDLKNLNTFGKGRWLWFPSLFTDPDNFVQNCEDLNNLFRKIDTICLSEMRYVRKYLQEDDYFVFVDNNGNPQIVGNTDGCEIEYLRGISDGYEQNIGEDFIDVANEFLDKNINMIKAENWKYHINWIDRLRKYKKYFQNKEYDKIDMKMLVDDIGYNGYSLHTKSGQQLSDLFSNKIAYPKVKKVLLAESALKPMLAKFLDCHTSDVYVGKYYGNGKNVKYIVGDLLSSYLHPECKIKKVFGNINIQKYSGKYKGVSGIESTGNFQIVGFNSDYMDFSPLFKNGTELQEETEMQ